MSKKLYEESSIQDIANAIREKTGGTETYKVAQMGNAVRNIPAGGIDYVIDQGMTGVWTWRKWASGIAEMWAVFGVDTLAMTAQTWGDLYTASWMGMAINKSSRQYPFAFVDQPAVTATPIADGANFWCATNTENDTGTSLTHAPAYQCVRASDATLKNPRISYYVVGRYK